MTVKGAGGTPGGIGQFLVGFVLAVAGGWLLANQVVVSGGSWAIWGYNSFGLSLIPFIFGVALLFFDGRSVVGWLLLIGGVVIILAGVIVNLRVYYVSTSLFNTLLILVLLFGGIGLIARSLRSQAAVTR